MKPKSYNSIKQLKSQTNAFISNISTSMKHIKEMYEEDISNIKEELLIKISNDYSLDINEMKKKYLKKKKDQYIEDNNVNDINKDSISTNNYVLFYKLILNDNINDQSNTNNSYAQLDSECFNKNKIPQGNYYIHLKNYKIYDENYNEIGFYKNEYIELNIDLINQIKLLKNQIRLDIIHKDNKDNISNLIDTFLEKTNKCIESQNILINN
jgi:hypothetical protein